MNLRSLVVAVFSIFLLSQPSLNAQNSDNYDPVLFTFGDDVVRLSEFKYVYNKNNQNDKDAYSKESLDEYLKLYVNFRLKVKEAEVMKMDTITALMSELETYRKQLAKSFLYDKEVNTKLVKEAYDRTIEEVKASHILIKIDDAALPADTLEAYRKATKIRNKIMNGQSFEKLARENSDDPSASSNGGNIGWFSAFQTIYPFESAAYNLKKGDVSKPVRTSFGYHIIKLTGRREAQGTIQVAHILAKTSKNATPEQLKIAKEKIDMVYTKLQEGENFDQMVIQYSEDKFSSKKRGMLPAFGTGKMVEPFEDAAFALKEKNDYSEPVQTEFGWHIIRLDERTPVASFKELEPKISSRIERDSRSAVAKNVLIEQIKNEYNFKEYPKARKALYLKVGETLPNGRFTMADKSNLDSKLFTIADKSFTQLDFVEFLEKNQKKRRNESGSKVYNDFYAKFKEQKLLEYEESQLERKQPDFKALMKEYRDGILLFDLTDDKVWSKAVKDTAGLEVFYETVKTKYMWKERIRLDVYICANEKVAKKVKKLIEKKGADSKMVLNTLNTDKMPNAVSVNSGFYERGQDAAADATDWMVGVKEPKAADGGKYTVAHVKEVVSSQPKALNEAKGFIVSDYQEYLEKQWIEGLRKKYPVMVKQDALNSLIKK